MSAFKGRQQNGLKANRPTIGIPATCYRTENAQIPKSAGESAGKSAGKIGTAGGTAGNSAVSLLFQRNRPPSSPPSSPFFPGTLPSTLPGTFGDLGVLSSVAGRWDSKPTIELFKLHPLLDNFRIYLLIKKTTYTFAFRLRGSAERIWGDYFSLVRRILGKLPANFFANFSSDFFSANSSALFLQGFRPPKNSLREKLKGNN